MLTYYGIVSAPPWRRQVLSLTCLGILLLAGTVHAQVPVSYSDFGAGNGFSTSHFGGWCVSGASTSNCGPKVTREIAAPIVPQGNLTVTYLLMALNNDSGTNAAYVSLVRGAPTGPVLDSWSLSDLPPISAPAAVALFPHRTVTLQAGTWYWLVASAPGPLGYGWTDTYAESLVADGSGDYTVTLGNGATVTFGPPGFTPPSYVNATLAQDADGTFTFTYKNARADIFSASGQLISQTDRHGYVTWLAYDSLGNLISITDPAGRTLTVMSAGGLVTGLSDPMGRTVSYSYDGNSNLISVTDVAGNVTSYSYDDQHQLVSTTDPLGNVTTFTYDTFNRVIQEQSAAGRTTSFAYSSGVTTVTLGDGNQVQQAFNATGELLSLTRGYGTPSALTWNFTYDPTTLARTSITDPAGDAWSATYDALGNPLTRTDPLGRTTTYTYSPFSDPATITDPSGVTTTLTYDSHGTLLSISKPLNPSTTATITYSHADRCHPGDLTALTDATGRTWRFAYDEKGDLVSSTDPAGDTTTRRFNLDSWLLALRLPLGEQTSFSHDAYGAVTVITDALGARTTYAYDADHDLSAFTNRDNRTTRYSYDADRLLTVITQPDGTTLQNTYNGSALLSAQIDGLGNTTSYTYDALERPLSTTDPLGRVTSLAYSLASVVSQRIDPQVTTSFTYDTADELTGITYSDGTTPSASFAYDMLGRRTQMTDGTGTSNFQWDAFSRMVSSTDSAANVVGYTYDLAGRLLTIAYPAGAAGAGGTVTRAYDAAGRLASVSDFAGLTTHFAYDPDSRLIARSYPNGLSTRLGYDPDGRLIQIQDPLYSAQYARDPLGLLLRQSAVPSDWNQYQYTPLSQLAGDDQQNFAYDAAPDITRLGLNNFSYDAGGELTSASGGWPGPPPVSGPVTISYDARGDRVMGSLGAPSAAYTYDGARRLSAFSGPSASATYAYTGDGLRASKTVSAHAQNFVWQRVGTLPLLLEDGANSYIYGPGDLPIEQVSASGTKYFFHQDQLGSTRALSDAFGRAAGSFSYNAYGHPTSSTGPASTPLGFARQYTDAESGLILMGARYYDPETGQFLTRDPRTPVTRQPYLYANGDPVNLTDPSGLQCSTDISSPGLSGDSLDDTSSGELASTGTLPGGGAASTGTLTGGELANTGSLAGGGAAYAPPAPDEGGDVASTGTLAGGGAA